MLMTIYCKLFERIKLSSNQLMCILSIRICNVWPLRIQNLLISKLLKQSMLLQWFFSLDINSNKCKMFKILAIWVKNLQTWSKIHKINQGYENLSQKICYMKKRIFARKIVSLVRGRRKKSLNLKSNKWKKLVIKKTHIRYPLELINLVIWSGWSQLVFRIIKKEKLNISKVDQKNRRICRLNVDRQIGGKIFIC